MRPKHKKQRGQTSALRMGLSSGSYQGASVVNRDVASWTPWLGSADADILSDRDTLVARTRDLNRNSSVAKSGTQTILDNVIGTGLRLVPKPNYAALGKDKAWADEWSAKVSALWVQFAETTACHAADTLTFDQISTQVLRAQLTNGESITLPLWMPERGDGFATKLQVIEADRLSNPYQSTGNGKIRGGIERDDYGCPIAYHIRKTHPGDAYMIGGNTAMAEWVRIPRYTPFGRLRVLHVFDPERSEQSRGVPLITSVLPQFKNADRYVSAELQAAIVNAMIAMIIQTPLEQETILAMFEKDPADYHAKRKEYGARLEAGAVVPLMPGDNMQPFMPARPAAQFGNFLENIYRLIAIAHDIPYELLMKDFSKTTYSSARAAMLEAWRSFLRRRDWLSTQWADPVFALFLEEVVNAKRIDAPNFYENRSAYTRCRWIGPARGWVDPTKEAQAMVIRLDNCVSTLEEECAAQGLEWREVIDQRAAEIEYMKLKGVPIPVGKDYMFPADSQAENEPGPETPPPQRDR